MEQQRFKVFSMMADTIIFTGTKLECEEYKSAHECVDDSMYILPKQ